MDIADRQEHIRISLIIGLGHTHTRVEAGLDCAIVQPGLGHASAGFPPRGQFRYLWSRSNDLSSRQAQGDEQRGMDDGILFRHDVHVVLRSYETLLPTS